MVREMVWSTHTFLCKRYGNVRCSGLRQSQNMHQKQHPARDAVKRCFQVSMPFIWPAVFWGPVEVHSSHRSKQLRLNWNCLFRDAQSLYAKAYNAESIGLSLTDLTELPHCKAVCNPICLETSSEKSLWAERFSLAGSFYRRAFRKLDFDRNLVRTGCKARCFSKPTYHDALKLPELWLVSEPTIATTPPHFGSISRGKAFLQMQPVFRKANQQAPAPNSRSIPKRGRVTRWAETYNVSHCIETLQRTPSTYRSNVMHR